MLLELKLLDDCGHSVGHRKLSTDYLLRRLLSPQTSVSPRLDKIRRIASQLALDDVDKKQGYLNNIKNVTSLVTNRRDRTALGPWFREEKVQYEERQYGCDLLTAAVYLGKFSIVKQLSEQKEALDEPWGFLGSPYIAAAMADDFATIDLLLHQAEKQNRNIREIMIRRVHPAVCEFASPSTLERLLASRWCTFLHDLVHPDLGFQKASITSSLHTFDIIEQSLKIAFRDHWTWRGLNTLLYTAASRGWDEMADHLLSLGAETDGPIYERYPLGRTPLLMACKWGSQKTVASLLRHNAKIWGDEIGPAARRGDLGIVKELVEHGADVNRGTIYNPPPIVSAVLLEYKEMFYFLLERGALLIGDFTKAMVQKAKEQGLDSMLVLLEEHGVDTKD
jgi:ankyrin repeat protein